MKAFSIVENKTTAQLVLGYVVANDIHQAKSVLDEYCSSRCEYYLKEDTELEEMSADFYDFLFVEALKDDDTPYESDYTERVKNCTVPYVVDFVKQS